MGEIFFDGLNILILLHPLFFMKRLKKIEKPENDGQIMNTTIFKAINKIEYFISFGVTGSVWIKKPKKV